MWAAPHYHNVYARILDVSRSVFRREPLLVIVSFRHGSDFLYFAASQSDSIPVIENGAVRDPICTDSSIHIPLHNRTFAPKSRVSLLMKYVAHAASIRSGLKFTRSMLYLLIDVI